jgi:hypothetical protein
LSGAIDQILSRDGLLSTDRIIPVSEVQERVESYLLTSPSAYNGHLVDFLHTFPDDFFDDLLDSSINFDDILRWVTDQSHGEWRWNRLLTLDWWHDTALGDAYSFLFGAVADRTGSGYKQMQLVDALIIRNEVGHAFWRVEYDANAFDASDEYVYRYSTETPCDPSGWEAHLDLVVFAQSGSLGGLPLFLLNTAPGLIRRSALWKRNYDEMAEGSWGDLVKMLVAWQTQTNVKSSEPPKFDTTIKSWMYQPNLVLNATERKRAMDAWFRLCYIEEDRPNYHTWEFPERPIWRHVSPAG